MNWFSKRKKEVNELDEVPFLPKLPSSNESDLPSSNFLPETPPGLQEMEISELPPLPSKKEIQVPENKRQITKEIDFKESQFIPSSYPLKSEYPSYKETQGFIIPKVSEIKRYSIQEQPVISPKEKFQYPISKKTEPVYIRLDKFDITLQSFNEIKNKIIEIEEILLKIKEIKIREEKEIEEWEKEIQGMKSKIEFIDRNIFNKLE